MAEDASCLNAFSTSMAAQMWLVNVLLVVNTILMGVMVGIGAYGHRYRHYPLTRFLFLGATTLFLPIISYVVSTIGNQYVISVLSHEKIITAVCSPRGHIFLVLLWTGLVQIVGINTTAIIAVDAREGRNIAPPVVLLVQAIWTSYLAVYTAGGGGQGGFYLVEFVRNVHSPRGLILLLLFVLIFAKTFFKYYAFYEAGRSFAFGRNPRLIVGYMVKLQDTSQHAGLAYGQIPPPLVVMGEDTVHVKKQPHGYCFKWMSDQGDRTRMNNDGLVTIDKVWQLDDMLLSSTPQLKDLCFSFALFKLLRCRFARYTIAEADFRKVRNFFWHVLLKVSNDERVFRVIADELSFLHDYYNSSHPVSYSKCWLPILGIFISLLSIGYCFVTVIVRTLLAVPGSIWQIRCKVMCRSNAAYFKGFGSLLFDLVPVFLLLAIVILAEARDTVCYISSNWTKVAIICRYVSQASWQKSPAVRKWVSRLLQCRCKLVNPWVDEMNQCSILVLRQRKRPMILLRRLLHLPEQKKNVKVPRAVKAGIIDKLGHNEESLSNGMIPLRRSVHVGSNLLWECNSNGIADILLVWHIATSIFEVRHPQSPFVDHKTTATHLSRYCAYLVIYSPELLPDDDAWCKSLYKAVKKDAERVLADRDAVSTPEENFQQLIRLLSANSKHEVLKNGAKLGNQLAQLYQEEETAWKALADFWLEILLYVAPSDHLEGHSEAIARGGELITLLWALLTHIGIVSRTDDVAATASAVV